MKNLIGVLYVALGACSYGVLATIVKLANHDGYHISGLIFFQFLIGLVILSVLSIKKENKGSAKNYLKLSTYGTSLGFTSCFYYLSIQYMPVSIGIVFLMQAIWMSVALEIIKTKEIKAIKIVGALLVIMGTFLAVNVFESDFTLPIQGIIYGVLAGISYTMALYSSNKIEVNLPNIIRSKYLILGGFTVILLFWNVQLFTIEMSESSLLLYGLILALFGTIIPPIMFNKGFPITGIGLGSIIAAIEIPVSVLSAKWLLHEQVNTIQWAGIFLIISSVILINLNKINRVINLRSV